MTLSSERLTRQMFALFRRAGILERPDRLAVIAAILHHDVQTSSNLTDVEVRGVLDTLEYWKRLGELPERCRAITAPDTAPPPLAVVAAPLRLTDQRGHQLVQVQFEDGGTMFTYAWGGEGQLAVGDQVQTPPAWWLPAEDPEFEKLSVATVKVLGSDYPGTITVLTKRAP